MGWKCCVPNCRSGYNDPDALPGPSNLSFHKFPADPGLKQDWTRAIPRDN